MGSVHNKYHGVPTVPFKKFILDKKARLAQSYLILTILSACGGGRQEDSAAPETSTSSGYVVDGYVANARVFRDANGNNRYDLGEDFANTNSLGCFLD